MIQKPLEQISKEDIESLVSAKVSERRTLDYKQQLPGGSSEDKREFLYDVSSLANALGGDLVFGIEDERDAGGKATGLPSAANGVPCSNVSDEIARLENLTRDGIEPRIQAIQCKIVEGFPSGPVIVMRVPKSLLGPHMVVFGGMARFYSRNSTGKYPMDIGEIRSAFVESTAVGERTSWVQRRASREDR
jgi:predicted HTH transcriptional regulator